MYQQGSWVYIGVIVGIPGQREKSVFSVFCKSLKYRFFGYLGCVAFLISVSSVETCILIIETGGTR